MKHYYFCNTHIGLASGCQVIPIRKGDNTQKIAETWMKVNGYKSCYVYDMDFNFIWNYTL